MFAHIDAAGCTNCCRHCGSDGYPPHGGFFSLDELRELRAQGWQAFPYFEASAHPDFPAILGNDICGDECSYWSTDGYGLVRASDPPAVLQELRGYGWDFISLTFHGLEQYHDWFVRREGAYAELIQTTRLGQENGFGIHWNLFLHSGNLAEISQTIEVARKIKGGDPWLELVVNHGNRRTWRYEKLRPSLRDVRERLGPWVLEEVWKKSDKTPTEPERLTEAHWLAEWQRAADEGGDLKPFGVNAQDPWLWISRQRKVYLADPPPVRLLGDLSEGREVLEERARALAATPLCPTPPPEAHAMFAESDLLHPSGASVRQKLIGALQYGQG